MQSREAQEASFPSTPNQTSKTGELCLVGLDLVTHQNQPLSFARQSRDPTWWLAFVPGAKGPKSLGSSCNSTSKMLCDHQ